MITDFWPSATPCASAASPTLIPLAEQRRARSRRQIGTPREGNAPPRQPKVVALAGVTVAIEDPAGTECIASADGNFLVLLQCLRSRSPHRLYVERIARQTIHDVVSHSMIFDGLQPFLCWCERDTLRFDAHTLQQLKRAGHDLLAAGQ
jgi:hypothetical protein